MVICPNLGYFTFTQAHLSNHQGLGKIYHPKVGAMNSSLLGDEQKGGTVS
jgi:hypothetical protein